MLDPQISGVTYLDSAEPPGDLRCRGDGVQDGL